MARDLRIRFSATGMEQIRAVLLRIWIALYPAEWEGMHDA